MPIYSLVLSVELDADAERGRKRLEFLIGQATVVVASGGTYADPKTGATKPKLHVHWRLSELSMCSAASAPGFAALSVFSAPKRVNWCSISKAGQIFSVYFRNSRCHARLEPRRCVRHARMTCR